MKRRRFALDVRPGAVALLAGLYFLLPLRWCARLALAVAVHELGHVARDNRLTVNVQEWTYTYDNEYTFD